jgi:hypothetical protein
LLSEPVIKRLTLSRHLFELAMRSARQEQEVADSATVNLLQDAIEIFFLAAFDFLDVVIAHRTDFPQYLDKLGEKIGDLPFRRRLLEINRVRVHSKHEGIPPNRKEVIGYVADARKFLEETCQKAMGVDFWTISLIALLDDGEAKVHLQSAEQALETADYVRCLVDCRKAFFVTFESDYDVQKDRRASGGILFASRAPYYARSEDYIKSNVKDPFDYIVLDYQNIDAELMKEGIDNVAFWNVWRLTPQVYRHDKNDPWIVQRHPAKEAQEQLSDRAAHVLSGMVSILLAKQDSQRMEKTISASTYTDVRIKDGAIIYKKADKTGDKEA